jgi:phosphoribosylformylglycinamidine synthase
VETTDTAWTARYEEGDVIELPIAHAEGRFEITDAELAVLESDDRILFRYCNSAGELTEAANPNGSKANVAGLLGDQKHVAVLMPHPERATLPDLGWTDGQDVLRGFA